MALRRWVAVGVLAAGALCTIAAGPPAGSGGNNGGTVPKQDPRAELFVRNGCTQCHSVTALGAGAATDAGPDLTYAYADVVVRYGVTLEHFLLDPTGVMRLVLATHVHLTVVDRDSILHVLRSLYEERRAGMDEDMPSAPPATVAPRVEPCPARSGCNGGGG